jgi:hypothetical protein
MEIRCRGIKAYFDSQDPTLFGGNLKLGPQLFLSDHFGCALHQVLYLLIDCQICQIHRRAIIKSKRKKEQSEGI